MRRPLSSLFHFSLLAFGAVLLPPSAALVTATFAVERIAEESERSVLEAAGTVDLSRALVDHAVAMERHARQLDVLEDPRSAGLYASRRAEFVAVGAALADPDLSAVLAIEQAAHDVLADPMSTPEARRDALIGLSDVTRATRERLSEATEAVALAARGAAEDARELQRTMVTLAAGVVPLLVLVLLAAGFVIVRPLRTLDEAIRELGSGELDRPIRIGGPEDVRQLGVRLEWLRSRLLAIESDRVRLFRHVSHELKTPLACIREGTQLLVDGVPGPVTSGQEEVLGILQSNAAELQQRIEDMLRISEIRRGDTRIDRAPVDLQDVVQGVLARHALPARARGVRFDVALTPAQVAVDAHKIHTAVDNLITNALKFTGADTTVKVAVESRGRHHRVIVEDEGPGIDVEERERVFEAFYQGRASLGATLRGTGLGLAIAREYLRAHGGELSIEDAPRGARMVATLPREVVA